MLRIFEAEVDMRKCNFKVKERDTVVYIRASAFAKLRGPVAG